MSYTLTLAYAIATEAMNMLATTQRCVPSGASACCAAQFILYINHRIVSDIERI